MTSDQPLFDPSLRSAPVEAVARKDQEIVAVGDLGTIICSEDGGGSWKSGQRDTTKWLTVVIHDDQELVAVGDAVARALS